MRSSVRRAVPRPAAYSKRFGPRPECPVEIVDPVSFCAVDHTDVAHLRRCLELARAARDGGNEPFGSLLVGGDGSVLAELMNTVSDGDVTGHPELALAAWASLNLTADERAVATLYTSCESCAMCAGGQYWAGIGRLVFALSGAQLADIAPARWAQVASLEP